ncbi:hypothetical protein GCM10023353_36430 [Tomitella cavernea]|uniref:Uncharacterized protein n=1 Tax=Tomitella cavernea TaxID=1387982 RepID=A0ABP9D277_9ACTN
MKYDINAAAMNTAPAHGAASRDGAARRPSKNGAANQTVTELTTPVTTRRTNSPPETAAPRMGAESVNDEAKPAPHPNSTASTSTPTHIAHRDETPATVSRWREEVLTTTANYRARPR